MARELPMNGELHGTLTGETPADATSRDSELPIAG
jgi:hypothetical protein